MESPEVIIKRSEKHKDTFDCVISLSEISAGFLMVFENQLNNIITAQTKYFDGEVILSAETETQLRSLNDLIGLRNKLREEIVKINRGYP